MTSDDHHKPLLQWVRKRLQSGMTMDQGLLSFMEQTFGTTDPVGLLTDDVGGDAAPLLELLFFPDDGLREDYEVRWGRHRFTGREVDALIRELSATPMEADLKIPGISSPVTITVPDFAVVAFVRRLNIAWQPPEPVSEALAAVPAANQRARVGARLRQRRLTWHQGQIETVVDFISKMHAETDEFFRCLDYLLSILDELTPTQPPFAFLMDKKFTVFQALCRAEAFERRRQTTNMEILMMQGERAAHGDIGQWRTQMQMIDRISQALYGRTRFFQQPVVKDAAVDGRGDSQDVIQVMRLLD